MSQKYFENLVELSQHRAGEKKEQTLFHFLSDVSNTEEILTYADLDARARKIAGMLQFLGKKGDRIVIFCNPGLDYIASFFGCLYGGMIAVPAYPPKFKRNYQKIRKMFENCGANVILASPAILNSAKKEIAKDAFFSNMEWIDVSDIPSEFAGNWKSPEMKWDDLAFLQYTSGSTSDPKGVMVSHGNLLSNLEVIYQKFGESENSKGAIWLPPYHDMGLIGGILEPLYGGFETVLMSPFAFVQNPFIWLDAISRYGATTSGGPNFAYELCAERITEEQKAKLNLSKWRVAFNGAEPVRQSTIELFSNEFRECGFQKEAFYTCYGLAEATLLVSGIRREEAPKVSYFDEEKLGENKVIELSSAEGKQMVSNGTAFEGEKICIVDPVSGHLCPSDRVGEIWVQSPCVAKGYWNMNELTEKTFRAYIDGDGPYMRTGDMGFLKDSELYLTGRYKDLIIIRGRNYFPQDIELIVEKSHVAFVPNSGVAFSLDMGGEEKLVVVYEIKKNYREADLNEIYHKARKEMLEHFDLQMDILVFVRQMSLPKTSSGKVQRSLCREKYKNQELNVIGEYGKENSVNSVSSDEEGMKELVLEIIKSVKEENNAKAFILKYLSILSARIFKLDSNNVQVDQPLNEYGFDSLMAVHFVHKIEEDLNIVFPMELLFGGITMEELEEKIEEEIRKAKPENTVKEYKTGEETYFALSRNQSSLYFMEKLIQEEGVFNLAFMVKFLKAIDLTKLKEAFVELLKYNPSLRTTFNFQNNEIMQFTKDAEAIDFQIADIFGIDADSFQAMVKEESLKAFDLEKGPLIRVRIYRKEDSSQHMLVVMHHLVTDFWTISIMVSELGMIYTDLILGRQEYETRLSKKALYSRFVKKQEERLAEKPELLSYWKEHLSGELPTLNLNADFKRPAVQSYQGASVFLQLDNIITEKLKEYASEKGITVYMMLLAAYGILLQKYTCQTDIITGTLTSGRQSTEFANVCGYFVNPVAQRLDLSENPFFEEYLKKIQKTVLSAFAHQEYPFELLVEELKIKRDLGKTPIFQNMFIYQSSPDANLSALNAFALNETRATLQTGELVLELEPLHTSRVQYELTVIAAQLESGIGISLQYNSNLFAEDTIKRMAVHFQVLLQNILDHPDVVLSELSILSEEEEQQVLKAWNKTEMEYPCTGLHGLVEKQAALTPDKAAVFIGEKQISYGELDKRANQLANYLLKIGLQKDGAVALCMNRSIEMVIALLAILKAGGYYIPLDPTHPKERLAFIVEDAKQGEVQPIVITERKLLSIFDSIDGIKICMDEIVDVIGKEDGNAVNIQVGENMLAYTIYTSGSTGKPKGVQISHKAAVNFMLSMQKEPGMTAEDVLLSVTTISFDIAGLEIFLPLICGAKVVIAEENIILDGKKLLEVIAEKRVTVMQGTPSIWRILLEAGWAGTDDLKILCGGEAFPPELAKELLIRSKEVWNMYGPTETTIWSTVYKIEEVNGAIPIGHPIANTSIYILDEYKNPVPIGVSGELYIGGDGLARGYYNRKELTEEKFLEDPFCNKKGMRMYRTGDLARYGKSGIIEYLGRLDHQVKVRGYRIETGEIEAILNTHPDIETSLVIAKENKAGINQLIAYLIINENISFNVSELRRFLKEKLPDYMLPSYFVTLEAFPQTPNGKIDRKVLPDPEYGRPEMENEYVKPRSTTENQIAQVWKEILLLERIGIYDNFFELGGNSMLMVKIQHRLSEVFIDCEIGIVELFQYPTIASFAEYLENGGLTDIKEDKQMEEHIGRRREKNSDAGARRMQRKQSRMEEIL